MSPRFPQRRTGLLLCRLFGLVSGICSAQLMLQQLAMPARQAKPPAPCDTPEEPAIVRMAGRRVRIFCLILTEPKHYANLAVRANNTWARKCDKYFFIGSQATNVSIPLLRLPIVESRRNLWKKVRMAFEAVHATERLADFDYYLKADDDTYVVMENLRSLLRSHEPEQATFFGRRFAYQGNKNRQYMSGGAGYVLSRQALRQLVSVGFGLTRAPTDYCNTEYIGVEDYVMGHCLRQIGVKYEDSLDELGRERFHPLRPETMVNAFYGPSWLKQYNFHPFSMCVTCISNTTISFHYIENVLELEFLLYHIRVARL